MIDTHEINENYIDQITAAKILNISQGRISQLCSQGRFEGATKIGWSWIIPKIAVKEFKPMKRGRKPQNPINDLAKAIQELKDGELIER